MHLPCCKIKWLLARSYPHIFLAAMVGALCKQLRVCKEHAMRRHQLKCSQVAMFFFGLFPHSQKFLAERSTEEHAREAETVFS